MLDIKFVRENPEIVKQNIRNKFQDKKLPLVDEVLELDKKKPQEKQRQRKKKKGQRKSSNHDKYSCRPQKISYYLSGSGYRITDT